MSDVLIVDDANQLDPLSATLVYQLALAGETKMIVTARADTAPQAIRALWDDDLIRRIEVGTASAATDPAQVDEFLDGLAGPAREVLDLLTVQEPIPLADLVGLTSLEAVRDAEHLGAVEESDRGDEPWSTRRIRCSPNGPAAALGDDGARRLRSRLLPPAEGARP